MPKDLTSEAFQKLLHAFSEDEVEAAQLYTELRDSLIRFFRLKGVADEAEAADETLDRVADKIDRETEITDLKNFAFGVARFVFLEKIRREQTHQRVAEEFYLKDSATREFEESDEIEIFRECFKNLYKNEKELLLIYFEDLSADELFEHRRKLARREGIELNALRNRVSRLRKRLEDCVGRRR